ncbi:YusG family protein [Bacillus salitolerans]|uniref:YusG family protein n=1 Tax=Bacillus salitolerans TaxID=1437434 RepID=A0ABW4LRA6_9BACI
MVLERRKLDITDRVVGKLNQNQMDLFVEEQPIGKMLFTNQGNQYDLKSGYEQENNRIYHYTEVTTNPDQKYVDCDENGWC